MNRPFLKYALCALLCLACAAPACPAQAASLQDRLDLIDAQQATPQPGGEQDGAPDAQPSPMPTAEITDYLEHAKNCVRLGLYEEAVDACLKYAGEDLYAHAGSAYTVLYDILIRPNDADAAHALRGMYELGKLSLAGDFEKMALTCFIDAGDYGDARRHVQEIYCDQANRKRLAQDWEEAVALYRKAGEYGCAGTDALIAQVHYEHAQAVLADGGDPLVAIGLLARCPDNPSAAAQLRSLCDSVYQQSLQQGDDLTAFYALRVADLGAAYELARERLWFDRLDAFSHVVALRSDGTVRHTQLEYYHDEYDDDPESEKWTFGEPGEWTDVVAVAAGQRNTLALRRDGTVLATGFDGNDKNDVSGWTDIVDVDTALRYSIGLRRDGTVVATDGLGALVSGWTDMVDVLLLDNTAFGIRRDGVCLSVDSSGRAATYDFSQPVIAVLGSGVNPRFVLADGSLARADGSADDSGNERTAALTGSSTGSPAREEHARYPDGRPSGAPELYATASLQGGGVIGLEASGDVYMSTALMYYPDIREALSGWSMICPPAASGSLLQAHYAQAQQYEADGYYERAAAAYAAASGYADADDRAKAALYARAEQLLDAGDCDAASEAFARADGYRDAGERRYGLYVERALALQAEGRYGEALIMAKKAVGHSGQAEALIDELTRQSESALSGSAQAVDAGTYPLLSAFLQRRTGDAGQFADASRTLLQAFPSGKIAMSNQNCAVVQQDGTLSCISSRPLGAIEGWTDVVSVVTYETYDAALRSDGTVLLDEATPRTGIPGTERLTDIVALEGGYAHLLTLDAQGKAHAEFVGINTEYDTPDMYNYGQTRISGASGLVAIAAGAYHSVGLRRDGTVIATGENLAGECSVEDWSDIIAIAAGYSFTAGLRADRTVVTAPDDSAASGWTDIVQLAASGDVLAGLTAQGTVLTALKGGGGLDTASWTDIREIASSGGMVFGLRGDGAILCAGKPGYAVSQSPDALTRALEGMGAHPLEAAAPTAAPTAVPTAAPTPAPTAAPVSAATEALALPQPFSQEDRPLWDSLLEAYRQGIADARLTLMQIEGDASVPPVSSLRIYASTPFDSLLSSWFRTLRLSGAQTNWTPSAALSRFSGSVTWMLNISRRLSYNARFTPVSLSGFDALIRSDETVTLCGFFRLYRSGVDPDSGAIWEVLPVAFVTDGGELYGNGLYLYVRTENASDGDRTATEWLIAEPQQVYDLIKPVMSRYILAEPQERMLSGWKAGLAPTPAPTDTPEPTPAPTATPQAAAGPTVVPVQTAAATPVPTAVPVQTAAPEPEESGGWPQELYDSISEYDTLTFGRYEQNNKSGSKEDIEWIVLARSEQGVLLLSRYILDRVSFHQDRTAVTWKNCTLRSWMNDTFLNAAFTREEQEGILTVTLSNPDNPVYGTSGCASTQDRVFALSYEEAEAYLTDSILNTTATEYARAQGVKLRKELPTRYVYWWLRTPGSIPEQAMITRVKASELDYEGNGVGNTFQGGTKNNTGVRPALWLSWSYIDSVRRAELAAASAPYGRLIKNAVGIRQKPDSSSKRLTVTSQGDQVELLGKLTVAGELWYKVSFDGTTGYLKAAMLEVNAAVEVPELSAAD